MELLPIVEGCLALVVHGPHSGIEVSVVERQDYHALEPHVNFPKKDDVLWKIRTPEQFNLSFTKWFAWDHDLMRIDGGSFEDEKASEENPCSDPLVLGKMQKAVERLLQEL